MLDRFIDSVFIVPTLLFAAVLGFGPVAFAALLYDPVASKTSPSVAIAFCFSMLVAATFLFDS